MLFSQASQPEIHDRYPWAVPRCLADTLRFVRELEIRWETGGEFQPIIVHKPTNERMAICGFQFEQDGPCQPTVKVGVFPFAIGAESVVSSAIQFILSATRVRHAWASVAEVNTPVIDLLAGPGFRPTASVVRLCCLMPRRLV